MVACVMGHGGLVGSGGPLDGGARGLLGGSLLPEHHLKAVKGGFEGDARLLPRVSAGILQLIYRAVTLRHLLLTFAGP